MLSTVVRIWRIVTQSDMMALMFRAIVFFGLITAALGSEILDVLVNAAASLSAKIQQQLETLQCSTR